MDDDDDGAATGAVDDATHASNHNGDGIDDDSDFGEEESSEDLDAFLLFLESRLRADFTSPDLSRIIAASAKSSDGNGNGGSSRSSMGGSNSSSSVTGCRSSPSAYLRSMRRVLDRAAKPVKLRALLSVLGLEPDDGRGDDDTHGDDGRGGPDRRIWKLLTGAERDDGEQWVRIVAGIVRGVMFREGNGNVNDDDDRLDDDPRNDIDRSTCRGPAAKKQLSRTAKDILKQVERCAVEASRVGSQVEAASHGDDGDDGDDDEEDRQREALLESLLIGRDASPTFVPYRYSLLGPEVLRGALPDADANAHFLTAGCRTGDDDDGDGGSSSEEIPEIFRIDARVEESRAKEEVRTEERRKKAAAKIEAAAFTAHSSEAVVPGRGGRGGGPGRGAGPGRDAPDIETKRIMLRGRFSNRASTPGGGDSLFRFSGRGRGAASASAAGGRLGVAGRNGGRGAGGRLGAFAAGRGGRAGRGGVAGRVAGRLGAGRGKLGAAAAAAGGIVAERKAVRRIAPGSTRAMSSGRGGVALGGGAAGAAATGGPGRRGTSAASSRMRVIGVDEAGELNQAQENRKKLDEKSSVEARKAERRRQLMETSMKTGLKRGRQQAGGEAGPEAATMPKHQRGDESPAVSGGGDANGDGIAEMESMQTVSEPEVAAAPEPTNIDTYSSDAPQMDEHQMQHQHQPNQEAPASGGGGGGGGWEQILQKSNKLSEEDRQNVQQFFADRSATNPPNVGGGGDDANTWKVKLNEEKTVDSQTGEVVKETLYLEMDYRTFGYKKTRKIKRK